MWTIEDYQFMSHAIKLAKRGQYTCDPNPRVGCVITRNHKIIAEGWHAVSGQDHAEINALNSVDNVSGATVYVTLEPCSHYGNTPPCADALINANIKAIIIAMIDPNPDVAGNGIKKLKAAGIDVKQGLLEGEATKLNPGFIKRMTQFKPYVRCKMAMSLDARTALVNGKSRWISNEQSRRDVHRLRAASSAIVTSSNNLIKDDPLFTVRDVNVEFKSPIRVIIDRNLKTPLTAQFFSKTGSILIYTEEKTTSVFENMGVKVVSIVKSESWLEHVFTHMAKEQQINEVLVEAGGHLCGALIEAKLVDELIVYIAPMLLGHNANPLFKLKQINELNNAVTLNISDIRQFKDDIRLTCQLNN